MDVSLAGDDILKLKERSLEPKLQPLIPWPGGELLREDGYERTRGVRGTFRLLDEAENSQNNENDTPARSDAGRKS